MSSTESVVINDDAPMNETSEDGMDEISHIPSTFDDLYDVPCESTSSVSSSTAVFEQKMSPSKDEATETSSNTKTKHATMDIYKPPSLRSGDGTSSNMTKMQLNVHAKEFVMGDAKKTKSETDSEPRTEKSNSSQSMIVKPFKQYPLNTSKSSISAFDSDTSDAPSGSVESNESQKDSYDLLRVKSSGNIGLTLVNDSNATKSKSNETSKDVYNLQRLKSSSSVPWENLRSSNSLSKVHVERTMNGEKGDFNYAEKTSPLKNAILKSLVNDLRRSKSQNAKETFKFGELEASLTKSFSEYDRFPERFHKLIHDAVENTDHAEDKSKIALGRKLVEFVVDERYMASITAKLSVIIMDKDTTGAYYDSLLNSCQMLYQTKKTSSLSNPAKLAAFLAFLQDFYVELKRRKVQSKRSESVEQPESTILKLISRCCVDIVASCTTSSLIEIEYLFHAVAKTGRDMENEVPKMFKKIFDTIREVLLTGRSVPEVRKVLLQLIELRACDWQLPLSALNFYYPKILT